MAQPWIRKNVVVVLAGTQIRIEDLVAEPTELPGTGSTIAVLDNPCGNLIRMTRMRG
jgi:hypothetical protein